MTQPTPYRPSFDFSDAGTALPPGVPLDTELLNIARTFAQILKNLSLIQKDDTSLRNGIVGVDQFDARAMALIGSDAFTVAGEWVSGTDYAPGAFFGTAEAAYLTLEKHTATTIVDDIAAGYIVQVFQNEQGNRARDDFTGDGVTVDFEISQSALAADVEVYFDGVLQAASLYTVAGPMVSFLTPPAPAVKISIFSLFWTTTPPIQTLVDALAVATADVSNQLAAANAAQAGAETAQGLSEAALGLVNAAQVIIAGYASAASADADRAETASDLAVADGDVYETQALGRAAVANGEIFFNMAATAKKFIEARKRVDASNDTFLKDTYSTTALTPAVQMSVNAPTFLLPSVWTAGYWWKKPRGTTIPDFIGSLDVDLSTAFPNGYSFDADGWLMSINQGGKLPAQAHKGQMHVFELDEGGGTGFYFATSTGKACGKGAAGGLTSWTKLYGFHGHGPHNILRRGDTGGSGAYEFEGGGTLCVGGVAADSPSGQPVLAAANTSLSGKASSIRHIVSLYAATEPTDAEFSQAAQWLRPFLANYRKWLRVEDCPREAIAVPMIGESIDTPTLFAAGTASFVGNVMTLQSRVGASPRALEAGHALKAQQNSDLNQYVVAQLTGTPGGAGTYQVSWSPAVTVSQAVYWPDMTVAEQNQRANNVRIIARNNGNASTAGLSMDRLTMKPPYANQAAPNVKSIAPKTGWEQGFVKAANDAPDDGRFYDLIPLSNGSTQDCPGGTELAQTTSTNYTNALGGTTSVSAALSRNVKNLVSSGMFGSLLNRNFHRQEQQSRKRGVGYTVVHIVKSWGLNTAFIGTGAVPDAATPLSWLEDDRQYFITYHGIADPQMTIVDPHEPDGNMDGTADGGLGGDPDYPNTAVGTNRLTALGYERAAGAAFKAAHTTSVDRIDGNVFQLNSQYPDPVHGSFAGQQTLGGLIHANVYAKRNVRTTAAW